MAIGVGVNNQSRVTLGNGMHQARSANDAGAGFSMFWHCPRLRQVLDLFCNNTSLPA